MPREDPLAKRAQIGQESIEAGCPWRAVCRLRTAPGMWGRGDRTSPGWVDGLVGRRAPPGPQFTGEAAALVCFDWVTKE